MAIDMFLFDHCSISHWITQIVPAYLIFKRERRNYFDLLKPNVAETVEKEQQKRIVARSEKCKVNFELRIKLLGDSK